MGFCVRATDGIRTRGLHLGKVALYQLSYYRVPYAVCIAKSILQHVRIVVKGFFIFFGNRSKR